MDMNFLKYRHIIWDWNGTLLDDVDICVETINSLLVKRDIPAITRDHYHTIVDFPIKGYYEKLGFDFSTDPFEDLSVEYMNKYDIDCRCCKLQNGAEDLLNAFAAAGTTQSILSASSQDSLEQIIDYFNIGRYFIRLVGLDNIYAYSKVENGKRWIGSLGIDPGEVLLIGDTIHDYEVSQAIGSDCLLVACGHHKREKLESCGVRVYDSLTDIIREVRKQS